MRGSSTRWGKECEREVGTREEAYEERVRE